MPGISFAVSILRFHTDAVLAWDWWKQRPQKAAEKARTEAYAEAYAEAKLREMVLREMMLRAGIDPDTGEPLPPFNNGNGTTNGHTEK